MSWNFVDSWHLAESFKGALLAFRCFQKRHLVSADPPTSDQRSRRMCRATVWSRRGWHVCARISDFFPAADVEN